MAFELADLRLFAAVVEHGSITRGAAAQHLSLPSASARIRALEGQAGSALLHRHRRGATPTAAGRLLAAHARDILARHDRMRAELAESAGSTVVLHAVGSAVATLLPRLLAAFLVANPDVDVDLAQRSSVRIVAAVADGRIDAGIAADTADLGRLEARPLRRDRLVVAAPPGHPVTALPRPAFADCLAHPFVGLVEGNPLQDLVSGHARPLGTRPRYRARLPDTASVRDAVLAGVGIAVLPEAAVAPSSGLVTVPLTDPWTIRTLVLLTRPDAPPSGPTGRLVAFLLAHADP